MNRMPRTVPKQLANQTAMLRFFRRYSCIHIIPDNDVIFSNGSVTLVSSRLMSGKKTFWQTKAAKIFDIYGCMIQNLAQCPGA